MTVNGIDHTVQVGDADEAKRRGLVPLDADADVEKKPARKSRKPANKSATPDDKSEE